MIAASSIEAARAYLAKMEPAIAGQRGHDQAFKVACKLVQFGLTQTETWMLLCEYNLRCLPPWSERELEHKLHDAFRLASPGTSFTNFPSSYRSPVKIAADVAIKNYLKGFRAEEVDLWQISNPRPPDNWRLDGACLCAMLYNPDDLINIVLDYQLDANGKGCPDGVGITLPRDEMIRRLSRGEFQSEAGGWLRMNPVSGGIADVNVTAYRFVLLECDGVTLDLQLSLFAKLPLPVAAIIISGGRSIHAWVKMDCKDPADYLRTVSRMLAILAKFGVDTQNKNPSRLSRLPGILRNIGATGDGRQQLYYLNPNPEQKAIL
jgi:hypothetical protein